VIDPPFSGKFRVSQAFGVNPDYYARWGLLGHNGIDWALPVGTSVLSVDLGVVRLSAFDAEGFGEFVVVSHDWGETIYAHLSERNVETGDLVRDRQRIGASGNTGASTGPHLHFGVRIDPWNRQDGWGGYTDPAVLLVKGERMNLHKAWPLVGMHEPTGSSIKIDGRDWGGYTVITVETGHDPSHKSGGDFRQEQAFGRRVIVRLNNGYGDRGTIPLPRDYAAFAVRLGNYARATLSTDDLIWQIGNEPNHGQERPENVQITPWDYARCFDLCYAEIKSARPGDLVALAAVGPWNPSTTYKENPIGDWLKYYTHVQQAVKAFDALTWHVYARRQHPQAITERAFMAPPFQDHHWAWGILDDWDRCTLDHSKPIFITECNAYDSWQDVESGFCPAAVQSVHERNERYPERAPIYSLAFYRWEHDRWAMKDKPRVVNDFRAACRLGLTSPDRSVDPQPPQIDQGPWSFEGVVTSKSTGAAYALKGDLQRS